MSFECFDEWDEIFLEAAFRAEGEAISSRNPITESSMPPTDLVPSAPFSPRSHQESRNHTSIRSEHEASTTFGFDGDGRNPISIPPPEIGLFAPFSCRPQQESFLSRNSDPIRSEHDVVPSSGFHGVLQNSNVCFSPPRDLSQRFPEKPQSSSITDDCEIVGTWVSKNGVQGRRGVDVGGNKKEKEAERLKKELGHVSKQLRSMEHKCMELQKDRAGKNEQLKCAFSQIEAQNAEIHNLKRANLEASKQDQLRFSLQHLKGVPSDQAGHCPIFEDKFSRDPQSLEGTTKGSYGISKKATESIRELPLESQVFEACCPKRKGVQTDGQTADSELKRHIMICNSLTTSSGITVLEGSFPERTAQLKFRKTIGVQTDVVQDCGHIGLKNILSVEHDISSKLHAIWGSPNDKISGRYLISKLLVTCSADFCVLFRCMSRPSKINLDHGANESFPDMALHNGMQFVQSNDAAKVSRLYEIVMKMRNEMAPWQILLEALLDLCALENVVIVHRSLHILHTVLQHLSCGTRSGRSVLCSGTMFWSMYLETTAYLRIEVFHGKNRF